MKSIIWTSFLVLIVSAPLARANGLRIVTVNELVQQSPRGASPSYQLGQTDRFRIDFLNERSLAFVSQDEGGGQPSYVLKLANLEEAAFVRRMILNPKNDVTIDTRSLRSSDGSLKSALLRTQLIEIQESHGSKQNLSKILAERAESKVRIRGQYAVNVSESSDALAGFNAETIH